MTETVFKPGDVVRLKSGGPLMTVKEQATASFGETLVWCEWFDDKQKLQRAEFPPTSLDFDE